MYTQKIIVQPEKDVHNYHNEPKQILFDYVFTPSTPAP